MSLLNKKGIVIRNIPRTPPQTLSRFADAGVATTHEALNRQGLMDARIRPIQQSACVAGNAVTVLVTPGDNWMFHVAVEQCRPGDVLVVACSSVCTDGFFGDLLATSFMAHGVTTLIADVGVRDTKTLREMGFNVWSRAVYAQGTVKETLGSVNVPIICGNQLVNPGDIIVADDDGVVVIPHGMAEPVLQNAAARMANEEAKRRRMAQGELGLDIYNMREKLQHKGLCYYETFDDVEQ